MIAGSSDFRPGLAFSGLLGPCSLIAGKWDCRRSRLIGALARARAGTIILQVQETHST